MKIRLEPSVFARIMSLPNSMRLDVLEFLGSTPVAPNSVEALVASVAVRPTDWRTLRNSASN